VTAVDWVIVAVFALSVLLGLARGVVRELFALAGWIAGLLLAWRFAEPLAAWLPLDLPLGVRTALAGVAIVVGTLLTAALAAAALRAVLTLAKLSLEDRLLGAMFGLLRGALIVGLAVLLGGAAGAAREPWWQASTLLPWAQASVRFASPLLPQSLARYALNPVRPTPDRETR
jgi:membrane protein required for colicin V production